VPLPGRVLRGVVVSVSFCDASGLLAGSGKSSGLSSLVDGVADPVDSGISADGLVGRVDEDDFEVLVNSVFVDPVRVKHPKSTTSPRYTLLCNTSQASLEFQLVYTMVCGFTESSTLCNLLLPSSTSNSNSVYDVSLLGFVTESSCFVGS